MLVYFTFVVINMVGADDDDADLLSFRPSIGDGNGVLHTWEGRNPCSGSWASVTCYCGSVASVCLDAASLAGNVSFLLRLPHLRVLSLKNNSLYDTLPALTHYRNARLKHLHLSHNQLMAPSTRRFLSWPPSESSTIDLPAGQAYRSLSDRSRQLACDRYRCGGDCQYVFVAEEELLKSLGSADEIEITELKEKEKGLICFKGGEDLRLDCLLKVLAEVLRKGFSGSTYKVVLKEGIIVVVKRLRAVHFSAAQGANNDAFRAFKKFKFLTENKTEYKIKTFRTDRGGEFLSTEFTQFCENEGIERHLIAPYTPQQNGVVELRNRTVMAMTRSLLKGTHMPVRLWGETVRHAIYLLNRLPTKVLGERTPFEAWMGRKPHLAHLRVFGCICASNEEKVLEFMVVDAFDTDEVIVAAGIEAAAEDVTTPAVAVVPMTGASSPSTPSSNTYRASSHSITNSPESYEGLVCFRSIADIYANTEEVVGIDEEEGEVMMMIYEELTYYQEAATEPCCLEELGLEKCTQEHVVYTRGEGEASILVGVYVDDLIMTGSSAEKINKFKQQIMIEFEMSDLGLLSYYLEIEMEQQKSQIFLRQSAYAKKILSQFKMTDCNATKHPMEPKTQLHKDLEGTPVDATEYRHIIACLRYLLHTRPDLSYSVGMASRYMERPTIMHHKVVKQILRYLKGTIYFGLVYIKGPQEIGIFGYSDSDLAGDLDGRKNTSGMIFYFSESLIVVEFINTGEQRADALTKALPGVKLAAMRHLHGVRDLQLCTGRSLDWASRKRILVSASDRLAFIHKFQTRYPLVHANLKQSNILIDEEGNGDLHGGRPSKSEVPGAGAGEWEGAGYAGVRRLQLWYDDTGSGDGRRIRKWRTESFRKNKAQDQRMVKIALLCTAERPEKRPEMSQVVRMMGEFL
ncbi:hypothetical protein ZIOFF_041197 [Zingiber officinale]|uniref:Integrase catalytic domain-containing protein n=1 Tax=Zingiber officinale TaxID=94328 RepID=A0A8J5G5H8_ZINOF|nr:hypothetical protein ZIOFF_041197 [Zingiber officinale]